MVLDRARTEEQPGADLQVRQAVAGQPRDLALLGGQLAGGLYGAFAGGLAGGRQLTAGPLGERLHAHRVHQVAGGAQLLARVRAAALAAQPLPVEQVGAGELGADAGTAQPDDRLAVQALGVAARAQQGADPGFDPQRPFGGCHPGPLGQPLQRGVDQRGVTGPRRRLGQLGHDVRPVSHVVLLECPPGGVACGVVPPEAVVQHRARVGREVGQPSHPACGSLPHGGLDQLSRQRLLAAPSRQHHAGICNRRDPGHLTDQVIFFDQQRRRGQLAGENVTLGEQVEREPPVKGRARVTGELRLASS